MNELLSLRIPSREQIEHLQSAMLELPQVELPTRHYFADGMYLREVERAAGTLIVGKVHRREHFYIVTRGCIIVWTETGMRHIKAGEIIVSKPGTKRATLAETDSTAITVHRVGARLCDEKHLERIETKLVEPDRAAVFDCRNRLIAGAGMKELPL
jgi:hypothetical protein